jgi:hypothetical protein
VSAHRPSPETLCQKIEMNAALDNFAHNPIIDEIVYWPPRQKRLVRIEREISEDGSCRVTLMFDDKTNDLIEIERGYFEEHWNEAIAVFTTLLNIGGDLSPLTDGEIQSLESARQESGARQREQISRDALRVKQQALRNAKGLFDAGEYDQFLQQFGPDLKDLPPEIEKRISIAADKTQEKA